MFLLAFCKPEELCVEVWSSVTLGTHHPRNVIIATCAVATSIICEAGKVGHIPHQFCITVSAFLAGSFASWSGHGATGTVWNSNWVNSWRCGGGGESCCCRSLYRYSTDVTGIICCTLQHSQLFLKAQRLWVLICHLSEHCVYWIPPSDSQQPAVLFTVWPLPMPASQVIRWVSQSCIDSCYFCLRLRFEYSKWCVLTYTWEPRSDSKPILRSKEPRAKKWCHVKIFLMCKTSSWIQIDNLRCHKCPPRQLNKQFTDESSGKSGSILLDGTIHTRSYKHIISTFVISFCPCSFLTGKIQATHWLEIADPWNNKCMILQTYLAIEGTINAPSSKRNGDISPLFQLLPLQLSDSFLTG